GTVEDVDDTNYDWWAGQMQQFSGDNVYKMPVDQHELMAMVAPRALLETGNTEYYWLSNGSNYVASRAAEKIYDTLGIGDRFGFYLDGNHNHCATLPAEAAPITAFVDKFMLSQMNTATDVHVYPNPNDTTDYGYPIVVGNGQYAYYFPTLNYRRWTDWWGTGNPVFPDNWNTGGTVVASLDSFPGIFDFFNSPWIQTGDTVEGGYDLTLGGKHPAANLALVSGANIQADISCPGNISYTLNVPLPAQSYTVAAGDNTPQPSANPTSPLVFQGSTTATPPSGAAQCVGGRVTHAYFSALGTMQPAGYGNPGGPGLLTSDVTDPLILSFHLLDSTDSMGTFYSFPLIVNFNPLSSANQVNMNPIAAP
ncbi:MAG: hypothetical protein ACRD3S_10795, partial [Terracidiphilus sp.]